MPVHDWQRVPSGLFHHFHQDWSIEIARALNRGLLPKGISALVERRLNLREADVLTIEKRSRHEVTALGGVATFDRPVTSVVVQSSKPIAAGRANRVVIRHHLGRIIAVVEIVSPGNKDTRSALRDFVDKAIELLRAGIHLLVVDLFPPTDSPVCASCRDAPPSARVQRSMKLGCPDLGIHCAVARNESAATKRAIGASCDAVNL